MGSARCGLGLTTLSDNLYTVGGNDESNCLSFAERYDRDLDSWTLIASIGTARRSLGLTAL